MEGQENKAPILTQKAIDGTIDLDKAIDFCLANMEEWHKMCLIFYMGDRFRFTIFDPTEGTRNKVHVVEDDEMSFYVDIDLGDGTRLRSPIDNMTATPYVLTTDDDEEDDGFYQESEDDED